MQPSRDRTPLILYLGLSENNPGFFYLSVGRRSRQWRPRRVNPFSAGTVFRRQSLTAKDGPRTERIKQNILT